MLTVSIILIMLIGICFGWKEMAYSYSDIHVADVLGIWPFLVCLLISMTVGMGLIILHENSSFLHSTDEVVVAAVSIVLTIVILSTVNTHFSTVTAFWGALLALFVMRDNAISTVLWVVVLLSVVIAPIVSIACSLLTHRFIRRYIEEKAIHLLTKQLYIKWLAYIGVVLCGIVLTCNYALLIDSLISPLYIYNNGLSNWTLWILVAIMTVMCLSPVIIHVYRRPRNGRMPEQLASLYGQTLSLMLFNIVLPVLITPLPSVIVSANLLKEGNTVVLEREGEMKRLLNMVIIAVATPMLSFLICIIMQWLYDRPYFYWVLVLFVILVCMLIRLSYTQYKKGKLFSRMLNDELKHRDEVSNEINRLDVMAVTSQFDSMSREIDFKHREIIDLSLFVRQQREYMTGVGEQLRELAQNTDTENIRRSLVEIDRDLQETLRYPPEMEKIYQQVEKMHHDFVCRLQMRCPNLTKRECRLAILLRLGFSSKEIANMVNLETKSVEINRYRLRKKLRLDRSENLVNYLQLL